jgi:predicted Zn-ribbon and HTH transcriptional regulator
MEDQDEAPAPRTIYERRCKRCGHEWFPVKVHEPLVCPKCRSPYWDREREDASEAG